MIAFYGGKAAAKRTERDPFNVQPILFGRGLFKASKVGTKKAKAARESTQEGFVRKKKSTSKSFCTNTTFQSHAIWRTAFENCFLGSKRLDSRSVNKRTNSSKNHCGGYAHPKPGYHKFRCPPKIFVNSPWIHFWNDRIKHALHSTCRKRRQPYNF